MNDTLKNNTMYFPEIPMTDAEFSAKFPKSPAYEGLLTKLSTNRGGLRTTTVQGTFNKLPKKGERFNITGEGLTEGSIMRLVTTSLVTEIVHQIGGTITFKTENSEYRLDYFKKGETQDGLGQA